MSNVIQLPDSMQRQWLVIEGALMEAMKDHLYAAADRESVLQKVKPVWLRYATRLDVVAPKDADEALARISEWVKQLNVGLLLEIVNREIELTQLRNELAQLRARKK